MRVCWPTPFSSAAAAMMILKVEPGGSVSDSARFASGRSLSFSSVLYARSASVLLWLASGFGSKLGMETSACTAPVRGSIAIAAPFVAPTWLSFSCLYAVSWARFDSVSTTFPPPVSSPVNMSLIRLAISASLVPARKSFSTRSIPLALPFTGFQPSTCAYISPPG